jgi:hypothetical protein
MNPSPQPIASTAEPDSVGQPVPCRLGYVEPAAEGDGVTFCPDDPVGVPAGDTDRVGVVFGDGLGVVVGDVVRDGPGEAEGWVVCVLPELAVAGGLTSM